MIYDSFSAYLAETSDDKAARITRYKALRDALEIGAFAKSLDMADTYTYELNDGQTIIKTTLRSPEQVIKSIKAMDAMIARLETQINGRATSFIYPKNLNVNNGYY